MEFLNFGTFPLFRLPTVVLREVLGIMTPIENTNLSLASSGAKTKVKLYWNTTKYLTEVQVLKQPLFVFYGKPTVWEYQITTNQEEADYEEETLNEFKKWFTYLKELMRFKICHILFDTDAFKNENQSFIDLLKPEIQSLCSFTIVGDTESDDDVAYILKDLPKSGSLILNSYLSAAFQGVIPPITPQLHIANGEWITFSQFIEFRAAEIIIHRCKLKGIQLNEFLRKWMRMESHRCLQNLSINISSTNDLQEICNLSHKVVQQDTPQFVELTFSREELKAGLEIQRHDGVTARLFLTEGNSGSILRMIVTGNTLI
ncbi:hypothetical protein GCK72_006679 [Caenorhabditis remanei]|uniref:Sdz-33 F-box domain-containing protein n=1 Tax=Caenorhabditis remanei TaxID=31234 RepID=A0A6A5HHZ8_CAERE|nr:hypothetical protein GCK72_006679 [Caenorhabditis remanei]KAF1766721.1 hypothetical protein GCK72_006679 [Caenorhabditis remanei]